MAFPLSTLGIPIDKVGKVTIGNPVSGGTPNEVLYINSSGNLAVSSNMTFDGTNLTVAGYMSQLGAKVISYGMEVWNTDVWQYDKTLKLMELFNLFARAECKFLVTQTGFSTSIIPHLFDGNFEKSGSNIIDPGSTGVVTIDFTAKAQYGAYGIVYPAGFLYVHWYDSTPPYSKPNSVSGRYLDNAGHWTAFINATYISQDVWRIEVPYTYPYMTKMEISIEGHLTDGSRITQIEYFLTRPIGDPWSIPNMFTTQALYSPWYWRGSSNVPFVTLDPNEGIAIGPVGTPTALMDIYATTTRPFIRMRYGAGGGGDWAIVPYTSGISNGGLTFIDNATGAIPLTLSYNDYVGINTNNPIAQGHINGTPSSVTPENVIVLSRPFNPGTAYASTASFKISNPSSYYMNTQLDIAVQQAPVTVPTAPDTIVMSLRSNGYVGIGTTGPLGILAINAPGYASVGSVDMMIAGQSDAVGIANGIYLTNEVAPASGYGSGMLFQVWKSNVGPIDAIQILNSGFVGIGTRTPGSKLTVVGSGTVGNFNSSSAYSAIALTSLYDAHGGVSLIGSYDNFTIQAGVTTAVTVLSGSNYVGVGTAIPQGMLCFSNVLSSAGSPRTYSVGAQNVFDGYYIGAPYYTRFLDIAAVGGPDGTAGDSAIRFLTNPVTNASPAVEQMRIDGTGRVGIGVTPTARLHLKAGTATANTAPCKFNAGTLLTTPEIGTLEFTDDGTTAHIYGTVRIATVVTRVQII